MDEHPTIPGLAECTNAAANRITTFVELARRYPQARLVFTGGSGDLEQGVSNEAEYAKILLEQLGLPPDRVVFENTSALRLQTVRR
jgi:hypothetical protein